MSLKNQLHREAEQQKRELETEPQSLEQLPPKKGQKWRNWAVFAIIIVLVYNYDWNQYEVVRAFKTGWNAGVQTHGANAGRKTITFSSQGLETQNIGEAELQKMEKAISTISKAAGTFGFDVRNDLERVHQEIRKSAEKQAALAKFEKEPDFQAYYTRIEALDIADERPFQEWKAIYDAGIPFSFLKELEDDLLLDEFETDLLLQLHRGGVPASFIIALDDVVTDIMDLGIEKIIYLNASVADVQWIEEMDDMELLQQFEMLDLMLIRNAEIPMSYIRLIYDEDLIEPITAIDLVTLYTAKVPESFLAKLVQMDVDTPISTQEIIRRFHTSK